MKYAHYDPQKENVIDAHYTDDIHKSIPEPHIEITEEEWQISITNSGQCFIIGDEFVFDPIPDPTKIYTRVNNLWVLDEEKTTTRDKDILVRKKRAAYLAESDPLFWDYQDKKITWEEWQEKKKEIRERIKAEFGE